MWTAQRARFAASARWWAAPVAVVSFGDLEANEKALDTLLDSFQKERKKKPAK